MKLFVTAPGDPSVGIFPQTFSVDCPFDEHADQENKDWFRDQIAAVFLEMLDEKIWAEYDYESRERSIEDIF